MVPFPLHRTLTNHNSWPSWILLTLDCCWRYITAYWSRPNQHLHRYNPNWDMDRLSDNWRHWTWLWTANGSRNPPDLELMPMLTFLISPFWPFRLPSGTMKFPSVLLLRSSPRPSVALCSCRWPKPPSQLPWNMCYLGLRQELTLKRSLVLVHLMLEPSYPGTALREFSSHTMKALEMFSISRRVPPPLSFLSVGAWGGRA